MQQNNRRRPAEWAILGTVELPVEKEPLVTLTLVVLEPSYRAPTTLPCTLTGYLYRYDTI